MRWYSTGACIAPTLMQLHETIGSNEPLVLRHLSRQRRRLCRGPAGSRGARPAGPSAPPVALVTVQRQITSGGGLLVAPPKIPLTRPRAPPGRPARLARTPITLPLAD